MKNWIFNRFGEYASLSIENISNLKVEITKNGLSTYPSDVDDVENGYYPSIHRKEGKIIYRIVEIREKEIVRGRLLKDWDEYCFNFVHSNTCPIKNPYLQ